MLLLLCHRTLTLLFQRCGVVLRSTHLRRSLGCSLHCAVMRLCLCLCCAGSRSACAVQLRLQCCTITLCGAQLLHEALGA